MLFDYLFCRFGRHVPDLSKLEITESKKDYPSLALLTAYTECAHCGKKISLGYARLRNPLRREREEARKMAELRKLVASQQRDLDVLTGVPDALIRERIEIKAEDLDDAQKCAIMEALNSKGVHRASEVRPDFPPFHPYVPSAPGRDSCSSHGGESSSGESGSASSDSCSGGGD